MRIIAGRYRGKKLFSLGDAQIRPTGDRVKESLFQILSDRLQGARVLALFCGSGALGIEALSRGATRAVFVDKSPQSVRLTRENLKGIQESHAVFNTDYKIALQKLTETFDLILIDPPYRDGLEEDAVRLIQERHLLRKGGVIFIEHSRRNNLINLPESYIIDTRRCGNTDISFLTLREEEHE